MDNPRDLRYSGIVRLGAVALAAAAILAGRTGRQFQLKKLVTNSTFQSFRAALAVLVLPAACLAFTGCTATDVSNRPRTGFEQLLMSTATDNALQAVEIPEVRNETVYVDGRYLDSYDEPYVLGSIRALLSRNGAMLQDERENADVIVEPRSGALGIDHSESLVGIPKFPIIIPAVGTFETPELSLYSSTKEDSVSKIALLAYRRDGSHVFSREDLVGKSHLHQYKILLFVNVNFTDIPAREGY